MTVTHFLDQMAYTLWGNQRALQSLQDLKAQNIAIPERASQVMSHIIAALHIWYARVAGKPEIALPVWGEIPLENMASMNERICALWVEFLQSVSDADIYNRSFTYTNSLGQSYTSTLLEILTHFPIHSEHHRGQIAQMVRLSGGTPANTDYIQFAREEHR